MSKLVHGFSNIIGKVNMALNGTFRVNQRGNFTGGFSPAKIHDIFADGWYVHTNTNVDYLELVNPSKVDARIVGRGYGKKGQRILLYNYKNIDSVIYPTSWMQRDYLNTTAVQCHTSAGNSLLFKVLAYSHSSHTLLYTKDVMLKPGQTGTPVRVSSAPPSAAGMTSYGGIYIYLEEDGEFEFTVQDYRVLEGAYKNPPVVTNDYALDLMRCKRYYQTGHSLIAGLGYSNGTNYIIERDLTFEVEMAGVPTITSSLTLLREEGSTTDVSASYSMGTTPTLKSLGMFAYKAIGGDKPVMANIDWIAEI